MTNSKLRLVAYGKLNFGGSKKSVNVFSDNFGEMNPFNSKITFKNNIGEHVEIDSRYFQSVENFVNIN